MSIESYVYKIGQILRINDPKITYTEARAHKKAKREYREKRNSELEAIYQANTKDLNTIQAACDAKGQRYGSFGEYYQNIACDVADKNSDAIDRLNDKGLRIAICLDENKGSLLMLATLYDSDEIVSPRDVRGFSGEYIKNFVHEPFWPHRRRL